MTVPASMLQLYNGRMVEIQVDIVSDLTCPWCFIGKRRLEKATAAKPGVTFRVRWLPFELHPGLGPEGVDLATLLRRKFGDEAMIRRLVERVALAGRADGIAFAFDRMRIPSTLAAHCLLEWAGPAQNDLCEALFRAQFEAGRDIGDHAVLAELAGAAGLDAVAVRERLDRGDARERVRAEAASRRVDGVPHFVFGGQVHLSGAQPPEALLRAIDEALRAQHAA
jgi:predicted DsbA family dithiol-disulfide isomerase